MTRGNFENSTTFGGRTARGRAHQIDETRSDTIGSELPAATHSTKCSTPALSS